MELTVKTNAKTDLVNITSQIQSLINSSDITNGICYVYVPHTTAAVTINENADPDVVTDLKFILNKLIPWNNNYLHMEGNSAAHMKTSLVGTSETIFIKNKKLILGTWQSIFFCDFDGPRNRKVLLKFIKD